MIDYQKRLVEVDEILKYFSEEELKKIPDDIKELIENNKDKEYTWEFDENKELKDQNLSRDTIAIISYLNTEFLLNDEEKKAMNEIYDLNEEKNELEKREKYNPDNIFKNVNKEEKSDKKIVDNTFNNELIEHKEPFFIKFKNFIFKILHINK